MNSQFFEASTEYGNQFWGNCLYWAGTSATNCENFYLHFSANDSYTVIKETWNRDFIITTGSTSVSNNKDTASTRIKRVIGINRIANN